MPIRSEVVLPRRVVPQPTPAIHSGGDCGACVLGGLIGVSPAEVYTLSEIDPTKQDISFERMRQALHDAKHRGDFDRIIIDSPEWPQRIASMRTYGNPSWCQGMDWFSYVRLALDAGYYALANVDHGKQGKSPDHWVLLAGAREVYPEEAGVIHQQVLVSCSARSTPDEEWVEVREFLEKRGGFNVYLARPAQR